MKKILLLLSVLVSLNANALFYFEPYIGYSKSSADVKVIMTTTSGIVVTSEVEEDYSDVGFGMKFGLEVMGFIGGVDYILTGGLAKFAGFVTAPLIIMPLSVSARTFLSTGFDTVDLGAAYSEAENGGFGVGVTLTAIPVVNINLDFNMVSFKATATDALNNGTNTKAVATSDYKEILLSVGYPF